MTEDLNLEFLVTREILTNVYMCVNEHFNSPRINYYVNNLLYIGALFLSTYEFHLQISSQNIRKEDIMSDGV